MRVGVLHVYLCEDVRVPELELQTVSSCRGGLGIEPVILNAEPFSSPP